MYRKTHLTQSTVAPVDIDHAPGDERQTPNNPVPPPAEPPGALAIAFAPVWLSVAAGALIGVTGDSFSEFALPCLVLIPLIGCVGLFRLLQPGLLLATALVLYLPISLVTTAIVGLVTITSLGPGIYMYLTDQA